ncbi:hypothetical protein DPMN_169525 [Dreissena polymorpha]|uniref:Uncharacterized protein n=1 Tax=Dreissena polymorpha TaxID=45954 RepID=A0A9D4DW70_DREPO|nr:hypothetical protein DPMN_169525 [Dreissena polymorpha]
MEDVTKSAGAEIAKAALHNHDELDSDSSFESASSDIEIVEDSSNNTEDFTNDVGGSRPRLLDISENETYDDLSAVNNGNNSNKIAVEELSLQTSAIRAGIQNELDVNDSERALLFLRTMWNSTQNCPSINVLP